MMKNKLGLLSILSDVCAYLSNHGYSNEQIKKFIDTAEILIDSGWECSETGFDSVWINIEKNKICLVNDHYYKYEEDKEWVEILKGKEED